MFWMVKMLSGKRMKLLSIATLYEDGGKDVVLEVKRKKLAASFYLMSRF